MNKAKIESKNGCDYVTISCPACPMGEHSVPVGTPGPEWKGGAPWSFNYDIEKPTLSPSLSVKYPWGPDQKNQICHFFITDGKILYCGDCTHDYAGKTLDLEILKG